MIAVPPVQIFDNVDEDRGWRRLIRTANADRNRQCMPHGSVGLLRRTLYAHDGQMPTACLKLNIEFDPHARLASDQGPRLRARRTTGPFDTRLEAWLAVGRKACMVHLVRRPAGQRHVRTFDIVSFGQFEQISPKRFSPQRHQEEPSDALFERQDEPLDHGNGAVLADSTEPRLDVLASAPRLEVLVPELGSLVGHQVSGFGFGGMHDATQEGPYGFRSRLLPEQRDTHDPPRVMVDDHADPPAERPALG
jgi:hypothetical protein